MRTFLLVMIMLAALAATVIAGNTYYCEDCPDTWVAAPSVPGDTCKIWFNCVNGPDYCEHYCKWVTTTTEVEGAQYRGTLKTFDDNRCRDVPPGVNPYTATYATISSNGTVLSVSHSWSAGIAFSPVKDVLTLSAGCSGSNGAEWHCDTGCSWSQPVTGNFVAGEYTKLYPKWIDTTLTVTGPVTERHWHYFIIPLGWYELGCSPIALGNKTAIKIERAVGATFEQVKDSAKCKACNTEDVWCTGANCSHEGCEHHN